MSDREATPSSSTSTRDLPRQASPAGATSPPAPGAEAVLAGAGSLPQGSVLPPPHPTRHGERLEPFRAVLVPPAAHHLHRDLVARVTIEEATSEIHPDLPRVPVWGYGWNGHVTSPGPLLEARADVSAVVRFENRLPASLRPGDQLAPVPRLPFATARLDDPDPDDSVQNHLLGQGGTPVPTDGSPIGWTSTHLHGAHSRSDSDGWPDNMAATGGEQACFFDNTYDNVDLELGKVGSFLWYHDHAMNATRHHVYAGLAGAYLVRDDAEHDLGLPVRASEGEVVMLLQDRNLDVVGTDLRLLHKTTPDTGEFFGPLTMVDGLVWPRLALRPEVYRLRLLNGSNARAYRLHLVSVDPGDGSGAPTVTTHHDRVQVIGTDGGLLRRAHGLGPDEAMTLAPAERLDVLVDLHGLDDGRQLHLVNSAQAPFGGDAAPDLSVLWRDGDRPGRNPYPWVARLDVDRTSPHPGAPHELAERLASGVELNPAFQRLVHTLTPHPGEDAPTELSIEGHEHHVVLLAETDPPGHLYAQELVADPAGAISLQLPGESAPTTYRVEGWMNDDTTSSEARVAFYDRTALRPHLGQWQVFRFVNTTGDTHPMHIHQSCFQPLGSAAGRLAYADPDGANLYDPASRRTSAPLVPADGPGRAYEPHELDGWKDVVRVDPGNVTSVAIRFDVPGRYVYHCHVLEHEDTQMMRPMVVCVVPMDDGPGMGGMSM